MKDWTEPVNGSIDVPDELMPLFNKVGMQIRFHTISGKNEVVTIAHIIKAAQKFFEETKPSKETKKLSNDLCPDVSKHVFCPYCGHKRDYIVSTDINSGKVCKNPLCKGK